MSDVAVCESSEVIALSESSAPPQRPASSPQTERGNFNFIDLALPRKIVIRQGATRLDYHFKPVPQSAWLKYFDGIVSTADRDGKEVVQRVDASSAGVALVEELLAPLPAASVPLAHKLAIAIVLTSAFSPSMEEGSDLGPEAVRLHCIWGAGDGEAMRRYKNLVHIFEAPTAEQNRRYRRDDSRAQIISGSRKGTTIFRGAQRTLAALYDELIVSVAGYAVNGTAFEGREEIARHMDAYHKVAAAAQLFAPAELELEEEEE